MKHIRIVLGWMCVGCLLLTSCAGGGQVELEAPTLADESSAPVEEGSPGVTAAPVSAPTSAPTPTGPRAVVVDVVNQVSAHALPGEDWEDALSEMTIYLGGEVWAKAESTSRLQLDDEWIRVAPETVFSFTQADDNALRINLSEGQMWLNVEGLEPGTELEIETPAAVASVRGTRFSVRVDEDGKTVVTTREGLVDVTGAGVTVGVGAGLESTVLPGGAPSEPGPISLREVFAWGMAQGQQLQAILPLINHPTILSQDGKYWGFSWTADSSSMMLGSFPDGAQFSEALQVNVSTGEQTRLDVPESFGHLTNSPKGTQIAYIMYDNGRQICVEAQPGADAICVSGGNGYLGAPYWSPDGEWFAFYADQSLVAGMGKPGLAKVLLQGPARLNLFKMRADGSELTQLTFAQNSFNSRQTWSPDSQQIVYVSAETYGGTGDVWIMNADGSDAKMIFAGAQKGYSEHVAWSPDGQWLATPSQDGGLWMFRPDGSEAHLLEGTQEMENISGATWSPTVSGYPLFFRNLQAGATAPDVYYIAEAGAQPQRFGSFWWGPYWSPDGSRVALGTYTLIDDQHVHCEIDLFQVVKPFWEP
ncbi:MAG: FecR domain-containing protein [Anaerolineaceae bacterium]|nr:FecR domain-containing protein [Anaerolineaceae bacterium]